MNRVVIQYIVIMYAIFSRWAKKGTLRQEVFRTEDVALYFQLSISSFLGNGLSNAGIILMIAALACVLIAEIVCIGILISKMIRARKVAAESKEEDPTQSHYAAAILAAGTVPQTMYITLSALAGLTAFFAVVLLVLLVICRLMGYDFLPHTAAKKKEEDAESGSDTSASALPADASVREEADEPSEETVDEPLAAFDENADADSVQEPIPEEEATEEDPAVAAVVLAMPAEPVETVTVTRDVTVEPADGADAFADGTRPYKVVEKIVTETVKETVKETSGAPAASIVTAQSKENLSSDQFFAKLSDFLDYELQRRREFDAAAAQQSLAKGESVPTFAASADSVEDEIDEDELDLEDEEDATLDADHAKDEEDVDDEAGEQEDRFTGNERIIGFVEETGSYLVAHYRKSFEAKLIQSKPHIKKYYSELKNALLAYKDTKDRISWAADTFHNGRTQIAKINVKTRILELYLAIDPASLEGTMYKGRDVGSKKKYADTPFQYKIRTPRKLKWALELVERTCEEHGLSPIDIETVDYAAQYPFDTTDNLVERKLIKEYIREEKPATTFELDPDHVPSVPDEDESVIPANANFSWEFDNERLTGEDQEPAPEILPQEAEPEILPEEEPAPAPVAEPVPVSNEPHREVVRETVKVTEMRYTERYYGEPNASFERTTTLKEPIEAIAEPAAEEEIPAEAPVAEESLPEEEIYREASDAIPADNAEVFAEESEENDGERFFADVDTDALFEDLGLTAEASEEASEEVLEEEPEEGSAEDALAEESEEEYTEEAYAEEAEEAPAEEEMPAEASDEEEYTEEAYAEEEYTEEEYADEEYAEEEYEEAPVAETVDGQYPFRPSFYASRRNTATDESYADEEAEEEYAEEYTEEEYTEEEYTEEEYTEEEYAEEEEAPVRAPMNPAIAMIDICVIEAVFPAGGTVNLATLKEKGIVLDTAEVLKVYASGSMTKPLTVEAHQFTLDAIRAISEAGGDSAMIR